MELSDAINKRRSVRKYKDKEVSNDIIEKLIDAARMAPSGMNIQPWKFVVVKDKEKLKKIRELYTNGREKLKIYEQDTSFVENATVIIVCNDKKFDWAKQACHYAIQNIMLEAVELGLGSLCLGALMVPEGISGLKELCSIPDDYEIILPIAVGYPDETPEVPEKKDIKDILSYGEFK
jgi:nitroreductase